MKGTVSVTIKYRSLSKESTARVNDKINKSYLNRNDKQLLEKTHAQYYVQNEAA